MFSKSQPKSSYLNSDVTKLTVMGFVVAIWTTRFTQAEDMGFFLSVSGLVSRGYRLYVETFEIKDPLFFYLNAIFMKPFGIEGAFYLDILLTSLALPLSYLILRELGSKRFGAIFSALVFELTLTGQFGEPIRTQLLSIFLSLTALYFGLKSNWIAAGIATTLVFFSKLPMTVIPVLVIFTLFLFSKKWHDLAKYLIAALVSFLSFIALMLIRGEFSGYLEMIKENFTYASTYQKIVGQTPGVSGHFAVWNGDNQRAVILIVFLFYLLLFSGRNRQSRFFWVAIAVNLGVCIYLILTAMWAHHLQILSLCVLFNLGLIIQIYENPQSDRNSSKKRMKAASVNHSGQTYKDLLVLFAILIPVTFGAQASVVPQMTIDGWLNPRWVKPPEIQMLESTSQKSKTLEFARLGANDDLAFGAFLDSKFRLVCMRHGLTGAESIASIDKYVSCLRSQPDVILVAPFYSALRTRPGNYQYYYSESQQILMTEFKCEKWNNSDYQLCLRS
jgi:hypothetical protein